MSISSADVYSALVLTTLMCRWGRLRIGRPFLGGSATIYPGQALNQPATPPETNWDHECIRVGSLWPSSLAKARFAAYAD
jgi:hypothetical protein